MHVCNAVTFNNGEVKMMDTTLYFNNPHPYLMVFNCAFQVNMKGLDGIQGPVYVGTGCVFNRQALYGYSPPSMPSIPRSSCCCCPSKKSSTDGFSRNAKREELEAAIYNLKEIDSKLSQFFQSVLRRHIAESLKYFSGFFSSCRL